jgi:hypothetical protein
MKFAQKEGYLTIDITVRIEKVWEFTSKSRFSEEYAAKNNIDTVFDNICLKTNLIVNQQNKLISRLKNLLTIDSSLKVDKSDITQQSDEVLYMAYYLGKTGINSFGIPENDWRAKTFSKLVSIKEKTFEIGSTDSLKINIQKVIKKNNFTIELPKAKDTQMLYRYIADAIYKYFIDSSESLSLSLLLEKGYKEPITLNVLQKQRDDLSNRPKTNEKLILGNYIHTMLPYLRRLPQFPPNCNRQNSLLTEAQAKFIDSFFTMFGFYNQSFHIDLSDSQENKTYKQLRRALEYYLEKSIPPKND